MAEKTSEQTIIDLTAQVEDLTCHLANYKAGHGDAPAEILELLKQKRPAGLDPKTQECMNGKSHEQIISDLEAQVKELTRQLDNWKNGFGGVPDDILEMVKQKKRGGLPLKQAIEVSRAQVDWDKSQAATAKPA